jgi:AcrR family transcriptional regulator
MAPNAAPVDIAIPLVFNTDGMRDRVPRSEQLERNREAVLAAARQVFVSRGYAGATLDAIADEAGFSKGVVYSRFGSKGDLFLALLERRIDERAAHNARLAAEHSGARFVESALRLADRLAEAEPEWTLLVIEFRAHAARDPGLGRRYAELHARTVDRLAGLLAALHEGAGSVPRHPPRMLAELILAIGAGIALERVADPAALPAAAVAALVAEIVTASDAEGRP